MPKELLKYLRDRTGWGFSVIYPKVEEGILRNEHRFWPKDLTLSLTSKDEIETKSKLITKLLYEVLTCEVTRLRASDRREVLWDIS